MFALFTAIHFLATHLRDLFYVSRQEARVHRSW